MLYICFIASGRMENKMKVLMIGTDSNKSGASLSMVVLAKKIKNKGIDVRIVIPSRGSLEEEFVSEGLKYYIIPSYNWTSKRNDHYTIKKRIKRSIKKIINLIAEIRINKIIDGFNPDIIHINTICSGVGARAALGKHKALIWHIREFVEEDHGYEFWNKKETYELLKRADLLIAISYCVYNKFAYLVNKQNIKMIYNGIDTNKFYYNKVHCFERVAPVLIYMGGSIAVSKGQYLLIEAACYLKHKVDWNFEIHILGNGDDRHVNELKTVVSENGLERCIYFDGFKDNMQMEWRKADIAVVASRAEAFGRVTVEAMLSGALIVGADTAGTAEIVTDMKTGLLFENGNAKSLAEKIIWAVNHRDESRKMALTGQYEVKERFTADKNASEIIASYEYVYNKSRGI